MKHEAWHGQREWERYRNVAIYDPFRIVYDIARTLRHDANHDAQSNRTVVRIQGIDDYALGLVEIWTQPTNIISIDELFLSRR